MSKEELERRYTDWKRAMLMEIYHSLSLDHNVGNPENYEIDNVHKFNILVSGISGLLHTRFRGEARYHPNPCLPVITRVIDRGRDTAFELDEISKFKTSQIGAQFRNDFSELDPTWWMLAQHYFGFKTRLLDITRNPLIALYFACQTHQDKDGYVYVFHSTDKTSTLLNPAYSGYDEHILDPHSFYPEDDFVYIRPTIALDRINRQEAEFLWVKNYAELRYKGLYESDQIIPIIIRKGNKAQILAELHDPQGINQEFLIPDRY